MEEQGGLGKRGRRDAGADGEQAELQRARDAGRRWALRAPARQQKTQAVREGRYTDADSLERLAKWVRHRTAWLSALEGTPATPQDRAPVTLEQVSDALVERINGRTRDLLSVEFFELGLLAARCVGRVVTEGQPNGTGFLVAPGLMLTNEHVLPTAEVAAVSDIELDYEDNKVGEAKRAEVFPLRPERFFLCDRPLDFALVAVDLTSTQGAQLDGFRVLPLIGGEGKVRVGEPVNVVQHPGGRAKQVVIRNNSLVDLPEGKDLDTFFHYEADTDRGSSGSPVFNDLWEVVALHHTGVPKTDERGRLLDQDGQVLYEEDPSRFVWVASEGIRVSRIVAAVREAPLPPEMSRIRRDALDTWEVRGRPLVAERVADAPESVLEPAPAPPGAQPGGVVAGVPSEAGQPHAVPPGAVLDLTIPVRIRIEIGEPLPPSGSPSLAAYSQGPAVEASSGSGADKT